ncbi:MAG: DUF1428 domain-containing protein [Phycisphaeraceae bacterium]|nr:DUF1428 domain-containing protein [Phycisphaeraceae bacterium]
MARYVDGFVIPLAKKNLAAYRTMARKAGKIWMENGALEFHECVGDDLKVAEGMLAFPKLTKTKKNETVLFSWIVFKSRMHRDRVNKKVMGDPRIAKMCSNGMPFDVKRMAYGGFKTIVDF